MGGGVYDELDVVGPSMSAIRHFDLLAIVVVIGDCTVEHAEAFRRREIVTHHADVDFR